MSNQRISVLAPFLVCFFILEIASAAPPTRKFDATGAPTFIRLDGKSAINPAPDVDGDFLIGPEYTPAPEGEIIEGVPQGKIQQFTMNSKEGKLFNPGIAREVFGKVDPDNPKTLIVETHEID